MERQTWPIARSRLGSLCTFGIPERLGDGELYTATGVDRFPSLEEVAGDEWLERVLAALFDAGGFAAWWTTTAVLKKSGLSVRPSAPMPEMLDIGEAGNGLWIETWRWRGRALVVGDLGNEDTAAAVLSWCGGDTEFDTEFLIEAPSAHQSWNLGEVERWLTDRASWSRPELIVPDHARWVIGLHDGEVYCAVTEEDAPDLERSLSKLAADWGIDVIPGPDRYAWLPEPS